jgi:hypothetical protein
MRLKKTLAALAGLLLLIPRTTSTQDLTTIAWDLLADYDLDATAFTYCRSLGLNNAMVFANKRPPSGVAQPQLSTSGSSTTVTCDDCFTNVAVGDILYINDDTPFGTPTQIKRTVTARASADSITIDAAADLTTASFEYRTRNCGTADTSGAFPVDGWHSFTVQIDIDQEVSASIDYQLQCRTLGASASWGIVSGPTNQTSTGVFFISTDLPFHECRVGIQVNTDDGDDLTTNAEIIDISVIGRR